MFVHCVLRFPNLGWPRLAPPGPAATLMHKHELHITCNNSPAAHCLTHSVLPGCQSIHLATMAANRQIPGPAPDHTTADNADFGFRGYAQRHARTDLLAYADTRLKQCIDSAR